MYTAATALQSVPFHQGSSDHQHTQDVSISSAAYDLTDNSLMNGNSYTVIVRQHPQQAKVTFSNEKATERKPLEPCPIVELRFSDPNAHGRHLSLRAHPFYFAYASLLDSKTNREVLTTEDNRSKSLCGSVASSLYRLKDTDDVHGAFFVFPDIAARVEGTFKLEISIFEVIGTEVFKRYTTMTNSFVVYHPREYKGVLDGTSLSKCFVDQGLKIRYRKESAKSDRHVKRRLTEDTPDPETQSASAKRVFQREEKPSRVYTSYSPNTTYHASSGVSVHPKMQSAHSQQYSAPPSQHGQQTAQIPRVDSFASDSSSNYSYPPSHSRAGPQSNHFENANVPTRIYVHNPTQQHAAQYYSQNAPTHQNALFPPLTPSVSMTPAMPFPQYHETYPYRGAAPMGGPQHHRSMPSYPPAYVEEGPRTMPHQRMVHPGLTNNVYSPHGSSSHHPTNARAAPSHYDYPKLHVGNTVGPQGYIAEHERDSFSHHIPHHASEIPHYPPQARDPHYSRPSMHPLPNGNSTAPIAHSIQTESVLPSFQSVISNIHPPPSTPTSSAPKPGTMRW